MSVGLQDVLCPKSASKNALVLVLHHFLMERQAVVYNDAQQMVSANHVNSWHFSYM